MKTSGAKAVSYHPMNVRDAASVKSAVEAIAKQHGKHRRDHPQRRRAR